MPFSADKKEQIFRNGHTGSGLPIATRHQLEARRRSSADPIFGSIDPEIDVQWARSHNDSQALHTYFDYFFTGQDIQVFIDGIDKPDPEAELPVLQLAFEVEQQKRPLFGFWSYTFDQVMRGTRIISGALTIHTTSTDYMTRMLSKAATSRAQKGGNYILRGLDRDEELIEQYWGRNINDDTRYNGGKNLFSSHPPFNLVILYGIQSSSVAGNSSDKLSEQIVKYRNDNALMTDTNDRLVATEPEGTMRIVLENCEIMKMTTQYTADGTPLSETYAFFARDIITPQSGHNYTRKSKYPPPAQRTKTGPL